MKNFAKASATPAEIAKFSSASSRKPPNPLNTVFEIKFEIECNNVFEIGFANDLYLCLQNKNQNKI